MCFLQTNTNNWKLSITRKRHFANKNKQYHFSLCTSCFCAFHFLAMFWHGGGGGTIIACSHLTGTQNKSRVAHKFVAMAMENILQNHCFFSVAVSFASPYFCLQNFNSFASICGTDLTPYKPPSPASRTSVCPSLSVKGVLSLLNISIDTSGYYICTSANEIKSATCNVTLRVNPRKTHSSFSLRIDLKL